MSYPVIKWVKGNPYLYVQESYRVKGHVRTRTLQYLGRATALDVLRVSGRTFSTEVENSGFRNPKFTSQKPLPGADAVDIQTKYEHENPPTPPYDGADSLTLAVLEELEGKQFVSRQFVADMAKMPGLKPAEKDLIEAILEEIEGKRPV